MDEADAFLDSRVNTCPYAVPSKKNIDFAVDGRLIHDAFFFKGVSCQRRCAPNELEAKTGAMEYLVVLILSLYGLYPETKIRGTCADVDPAFHQVSSHGKGRLPKTRRLAISLTAIFGYRDSSGIFRILEKGDQFYYGM